MAASKRPSNASEFRRPHLATSSSARLTPLTTPNHSLRDGSTRGILTTPYSIATWMISSLDMPLLSPRCTTTQHDALDHSLPPSPTRYQKHVDSQSSRPRTRAPESSVSSQQARLGLIPRRCGGTTTPSSPRHDAMILWRPSSGTTSGDAAPFPQASLAATRSSSLASSPRMQRSSRNVERKVSSDRVAHCRLDHVRIPYVRQVIL